MSKLYYFSAPWCGPCKMLGPVMDQSGLPIQKFNVDNDTELSSKYMKGVRYFDDCLKKLYRKLT